MKYDFYTPVDRKDTGALKIDKSAIKEALGANYYDDSIPLWVADMDFRCPHEIREALKEVATREIYGYTIFTENYYDSIIQWYKRRHKMYIQKEWIVYCPGTVKGLRSVIMSLTEENDGIIIQPPVYYPFQREIIETGRKVINNDLIRDENNNYKINFEEFERQCKKTDVKMFIFCNPHNPIGEIWQKQDVQELIDICRENHVLFFSDEIHSDILREGEKFTSALNLRDNNDVIVATSPNKTFNLAGLQVSNLIISNEKIRSKLTHYIGTDMPNPFSLEAAIAAYTKCEVWAEEMNKVIDENLQYMYEFFNENMPKIKFNIPKGTYLAWVDFRGYEYSEEEIVRKCSEEARVIIEGGSIFGTGSKGFVRINIACPREVLTKALNRMKDVFKD